MPQMDNQEGAQVCLLEGTITHGKTSVHKKLEEKLSTSERKNKGKKTRNENQCKKEVLRTYYAPSLCTKRPTPWQKSGKRTPH